MIQFGTCPATDPKLGHDTRPALARTFPTSLATQQS